MKNINITQAILIGISIIAILTAVIIFATFRGKDNSSPNGTVVLWGTIPKNTFGEALLKLTNQGKEIKGLVYVQKSASSIDSELVKAIAEGTGPDLVLLDEKKILQNKNIIQKIPFESYPLRNYQDLFIQESSLLETNEGFLGFPFLVDPIVMYYNKNMLTNAGYSKPPETWTEVLSLVPVLTQKDSSFNISKSAISLGSFDNINNAKDIYWTLVLQAGNPVIEKRLNNVNKQEYKSILKENLNYTLNPAYAATNFFTQFSNPVKTVYSWNRSLQSSQTMFISEELAFYLGYQSEFKNIRKLNPNLNFDVTLVPQSQSSTRKVTYGSMSTLVIPRTAKNIKGATLAMYALTSKESQGIFAKELNMSSVRKDILAVPDKASPYESIFSKAAIMSQGILEPDPIKTSIIVKELIETVISGQYEVSEAVSRADEKLVNLLPYEKN